MKKSSVLFCCCMILIQQVVARGPIGNHSIHKFSSPLKVATGSTAIGVTVAGGNGYGTGANQIDFPTNVFVDAGSNVYVADLTLHRIQKWAPGAPSGITVAGGNGVGADANQLNSPTAVYITGNGDIYIADSKNYRIQKWSSGATSGITVAGGNGKGSAANQFGEATDVFVDGGGNIYICDQNNDRVQKWVPAASSGVTVARGPGNQLLPNNIFIDAPGNIYVATSNAHKVEKWAPGALTGVTVAGGNGSGSAPNQLELSIGIFVDASGNLYIADGYNGRIQKWAPGALEGTTVAGGNNSGSGPTQLSLATDVFVSPDGSIYVADGFNFRIQKFAPVDNNSYSPSARTVAGGNGYGGAANQLKNPKDIFVDKDGNLYISDNNNNRVQKWAPGAVEGITVAGSADGYGGYESNQLLNPNGIFVDMAGNVYIADQVNNRIQKWAPGAISGLTVAGGLTAGNQSFQLNRPAAVFVDAAGNIYIADAGNHRIQKWAPGASSGITVVGNGAGSTLSQLNAPEDVFLDAAGNLYVADAGNYRIQKFLPGSQTGVTVAGGPPGGANPDQLNNIADIFVDAGGNIYIADRGNNRIQRWAPGASTGITVAGGYGIGSAPEQLYAPTAVFVDAGGSVFAADEINNRIQKFKSNGLSYKYYEGSWTALPNFNTIKPVIAGLSANIDILSRKQGRTDNYAFLWEGNITIPAPGDYTFETVSDDGSKFYFNTQYAANAVALVNNDGLHAAISATGTVTIPAAGVYPIAISFFEKDGGESIQVFWTGPGISRQPIPNSAFSSSGPANNTAPGIPLNLRVISKTGNSIRLDWDNSSDYTSATVYDVYVGGVKQYTTGESEITADQLSPNTLYTFTVKARDPAGNTSGFSNAVTETTSGSINNGVSYRYYEGNWDLLPDFNTLTPVKTGKGANIDISVRPVGRMDNFAFVWEGNITIPAPGNYTFETVSDDGSKLYFNSLYASSVTPLVNNDGLHAPASASGSVYIASAGQYPIAITFFEKDGGEHMQVYWTGPGITKQLIPDSAFGITIPQYSGVNYKYYEGSWTTLPDFNALTPVKTGNSPNVDIAVRPAGRNDNFGFLWEGYINIPSAGSYTFETISDDGSKLYFNQAYSAATTALVNNGGLHAASSATGSIYIPAAGPYPIAMSFFEKDGGESMQVYWSGPGISRQLIPNEAFAQPIQLLTSITGTGLLNGHESADAGKEKTRITKVYPDPFIDRFKIDFYNASPSNDIGISLRDIYGRLVYSYRAGKLAAGNNSITVPLNGSRLTNGVFLVTLSVNGKTAKTISLLKTNR